MNGLHINSLSNFAKYIIIYITLKLLLIKSFERRSIDTDVFISANVCYF